MGAGGVWRRVVVCAARRPVWVVHGLSVLFSYLISQTDRTRHEVTAQNHTCSTVSSLERHTSSQHYASITPLQITANMTTTTTVRLTPSCETNTRLLCVTTFVYATPRLHQSTRRYFTRWSCCCRKFLLKAFTANAAGAHSAPSGISVRTAPKPAQDRRRHVNCSGSARIVCKAY